MATEMFDFLVFIDDDPATNFYHEIIVKQSGVVKDYLFFESPIDALEFLKKEEKKEEPRRPEYIFLDINMPCLNGWEFLEQYILFSGINASSIIMLSTSPSPLDKEEAKRFDVIYKFLNKPLEDIFLRQLKTEPKRALL